MIRRCADRLFRCVAKLPIRKAFSVIYGGSVCCSFLVVIVTCAISIHTLRSAIVSESKEALADQIKVNSAFVLQEAGDVVGARFKVGLHAFVLPQAFVLQDVARLQAAYSVRPGASYPDTSVSSLKQPLSTDPRYTCEYGTDGLDAQRGCLASGLQLISPATASVYLPGFEVGGGNAADLMRLQAGPVDLTALADPYVAGSWSSSSDWTEAFIGLEMGGVYRQVPGVVGDLSADAQGRRTFDPRNRPWFTATEQMGRLSTEKMTMTNEDQGRAIVLYGAPYKDLYGKGYLLSITAPVQDSRGQTIGVAGTSLRALSLPEMIEPIKMRTSGSAHLYHVASGMVAASPQWSAAASEPSTMPADEIELAPGVKLDLAGACRVGADKKGSGESEVLLVRISLLNGAFCVVASTPMRQVILGAIEREFPLLTPAQKLGWLRFREDQELECDGLLTDPDVAGLLDPVDMEEITKVLRSIEEQEEQIEQAASSMFVEALVLSVICFSCVIVLLFCLAMQLSQPLINTSRDSARIAKNIGGDLFDGVTAKKSVGIGEVSLLRKGFVNILQELMSMRQGVRMPARNPLYETQGFATAYGADSSHPTDRMLGDPQFLAVEPDAELKKEESRLVMKASDIRCYHRVVCHLFVGLVLPLVVALLVVIIRTTVQMKDSVEGWVAPVKAEMIEEELSILDVRAFERAQLVAETFSSYRKTLEMVRDYTESLYDGQMDASLNAPYESYFSPAAHCPSWAPGARCAQRALFSDTRQRKPDGSEARRVNLESSVAYVSRASVPGSLRHSGPVLQTNGSQAEQTKAGHLDNVLRVAYFSSESTNIYLGFEETSTLRQYPYMDLEGLQNSRRCFDPSSGLDNGQRVDNYMPQCRGWYARARGQAAGGVAFNPVDMDAVTRLPFVSLSTPLHVRGELLGVVGVDSNLAALQEKLQGTRLYKRGYCYLYDQDLYAIVHKNMEESMMGRRVEVADLESLEDMAFRRAFVDGVLAKTGSKGRWLYPYHNHKTDEWEDWHYTFLPVPSTPYTLVCTVLKDEVQQAATELQDRMRGVVDMFTAFTCIIFILATLFLLWFTWKFNIFFAKPVTNLIELIANAKPCNYRQDVDQRAADTVCSQELREVHRNFEHMLTALRFGNAAYYGGCKAKEIRNLRAARELINRNEGAAARRGRGVVLSNLGNCVASMTPKDRQNLRLTAEESDAPALLRAAVENAEELSSENFSGITQDTIGQRRLGLALALLSRDKSTEAAEELRAAARIHASMRSWQHLARLAFTIAARVPGKSEGNEGRAPNAMRDIDDDVLGAAKSAAEAGAGIFKQDLGSGSGEVSPQDGVKAAQLCFALYVLCGRDERHLLWALGKVPHLDPPEVCRLAAYAKYASRNDPSIVSAVDSRLEKTKGWTAGPVTNPTTVGGPSVIQVCFVMDCTGSMGSWIDAAKRQIIAMADRIAEEVSGKEVQMSFVCYRDFDSGKDNIVSRDFTNDIGTLKTFISGLRAQGGADFPEDMAGGLAEAMGLNWGGGEACKFVVLVADAPCHGGRRYHDFSDSYPDGGGKGMPDPWLQQMRENGTQLIFVRINNATDKMVRVFREIYDNGERDLIQVDLSSGDTSVFEKAITEQVVANIPAGVTENL